LRRDVIIIKDPEVAKLFADETRRNILHILRHNECSITDLAKTLEKSHSSILHHLNLLKKAGLVEETRTEKVRNLVQTYYQSTAKRFIISYTLSESLGEVVDIIHPTKNMVQEILEGLETFGIEVAEENREEAAELIGRFLRSHQRAFEETIDQQVEPLNIRRHFQRRIIQLLTRIRLSDDQEYNDTIKVLREILTPSVKEGSIKE
jgi:DNA-binding transcriptional ArsR family regulator